MSNNLISTEIDSDVMLVSLLSISSYENEIQLTSAPPKLEYAIIDCFVVDPTRKLRFKRVSVLHHDNHSFIKLSDAYDYRVSDYVMKLANNVLAQYPRTLRTSALSHEQLDTLIVQRQYQTIGQK